MSPSPSPATRPLSALCAAAAWTMALILVASACCSVARADVNESADRPLQQAAITAGGAHTCALSAAGDVRCWGLDGSGQLGDGLPKTDLASPSAPVVLGLPAKAISAGNDHTCALLINGAVRCWGRDANGQLGDGPPATESATPAAAVALGQPARAVTAGEAHTCALLADGSVRCWGLDDHGQLGDGASLVSTSAPAAPVALGQPARSISAGSSFTCALLADRTVRCWGSDISGELGDGAPLVDKPTPASVVGLGQDVSAISAGTGHVCALLADGAVRCWGWNDNMQLGLGPEVANTPAPSAVVALPSRARSITTGFQHTCAVLADDSARCWGYDGGGQLGDGLPDEDNDEPRLVKLGEPVRAVTAGDWHTCALTAAATLRCWSNDNEGQLGDGLPKTSTNAPADPVGLPPFGAVDSADTALGVSSAAATMVVGDRFTLTFTQTNDGPDRATSTVAAPLPSGFVVDEAVASQGQYRSDTGQWAVGALAPGAGATLTLRARALVPISAVMVAETIAASAQDPDSTPGDHDPLQDDRRTIVLTAAAPPPPPSAGLVPTRLTLGLAGRRVRKPPLLYAATVRLQVTQAPLAEACRGQVYLWASTLGPRAKTLARRRVTLHLQRGLCQAKARIRIPASTRLRRSTKLAIAAQFSGGGGMASSYVKRTIKLKTKRAAGR
jgi:alpha-tubulin suppressor-like RCC1 family protein